jgi:hypothetical protein
MRRHLIVGRFGPLDQQPLPTAADEVVTELDLLSSNRRLAHGVNDALIALAKLSAFPSELGLDLLILAALVYLADTRISRTTESQDSWTRELRLVVPVSEPALWRAVEPELRVMLDFLSGDRWTVGFRARPLGFEGLVPPAPADWSGAPFSSVSLFSGGLDSLIGAIDQLESNQRPLLVSHASDGATSAAQSGCLDVLKKHYEKLSPSRLRLWMNFPNGVVKNVESENTTRARSFLFFAAAAFAGTGLGKAFTLRTPENGLIALNVPLDVLRLGSNSTRTTHPFYIARWNHLLASLGIPGRVENPYWNRTKGEMAAACANQTILKKLVASSLSCSAPAKGRWKKHSIEHCGYCLPCLIRRAALHAAWGPSGDPTTYGLPNLAERPLDTRLAEGQQVRSFQFAAARLQARPGLENILVHKPGSLADEPVHIPELAAVYRRGLLEVAALLQDVRTKPS